MLVYGVFCCLKSTLIIVLLAKREQLLAATETFSACVGVLIVWGLWVMESSRLVAVDSSSYNWFYSISSCEACLRLSLPTYSAELVGISETSQVSECDCTKGHQRDKFCKKLWEKK